MGFDQENILYIDLQNTDANRVKQELSKLHEVINPSFFSLIPGTSIGNFDWVKTNEMGYSIDAAYMSIDHQYIENHNIESVAYRINIGVVEFGLVWAYFYCFRLVYLQLVLKPLKQPKQTLLRF